MMPEEYGEPQQPDMVDEVQVPAQSRQWSLDTNTLMMAALGVLGVGFAVWFLIQYTQAKAKAAVEASSNE